MNIELTQTWNVEFDKKTKRDITSPTLRTVGNVIRQKLVLVNWDSVERALTLDIEANPVFVGNTMIHFASGANIQVVESLSEIKTKLGES